MFLAPDAVYRGLSARALEEWERLLATRFFPAAIAAGHVVGSERVAPDDLPPDAAGRPWAAGLRHERIPFVSYPYEWCFSMLRDAAALQLQLLAAALDEGMVLKDATPYNVQFRGARPVFIDVPSFVRLGPGEPWPGYRQFCELNLYPLFLQAYKGVEFHPWLRGRVDGITPAQMRRLMSKRDLFRPGVLLHVWLHASMQGRHDATQRDVKQELAKAGFHAELIKANVARLRKLVGKLAWKAPKSEWSDYTDTNSYDEENRRRKHDFVRAVTTARPRSLVWDLGCNTGEYSRIAAESADQVVAMDGDHLAIDRLYRQLRDEGHETILPLVMNLSEASPGLGWRGSERQALEDRGRPDLVLCLALIHHMVISSNIPMREFVGWLASLGGDLVIEFVGKDDAMVQTLLRNKEDRDSDYEREPFEQALGEHFEIVRREELAGGASSEGAAARGHGKSRRAALVPGNAGGAGASGRLRHGDDVLH